MKGGKEMKQENIQKEIEKTEEKLKQLRQKLEEEKNKTSWIKIKELGIEIQKDVHHKGKSYDKLKSEFGEEYLEEHLLTLSHMDFLFNSKYAKQLKMDGSSANDDFFFKQPIPQNKSKGYVAGFCVYSVCVYLDCNLGSGDSDSSLGVRFARKISGKK